MGLFRKMASIGTAGAIDLRSDKERTARKTAKGARAAKRSAVEAQEQTRLLAEQNRLLAQRGPTAPATTTAPSVEQRLAELDRLAHSGVITTQEQAARRAEVLRDI